jgi:hypothetical protein
MADDRRLYFSEIEVGSPSRRAKPDRWDVGCGRFARPSLQYRTTARRQQTACHDTLAEDMISFVEVSYVIDLSTFSSCLLLIVSVLSAQ